MDFDSNNNGVPDYKEPWFWLFFGRLVSTVVKTFAAPHTIAFKTAEQFDRAVGPGRQ